MKGLSMLLTMEEQGHTNNDGDEVVEDTDVLGEL